MANGFAKLQARLADVNALHSAVGMMDWDQQCYMPHGGGAARAEHVSALTRMAHEVFVSDETGGALQDAEAEVGAGTEEADMVRVVRRDFDIATKLPAELVAEKSKLGALGHEVWVEARKNNDFAAFAPALEKLVDICKQEAECLGYTDHIYDALTDQYEEGATKTYWDGMFDSIRQPLVDLVAAIGEKPKVDDGFLHGNFDVEAQRAFSMKLLGAIGFDLNRGRLDVAAHPFCTGWSIGDIRLTTRFLDYLPSAVFGTLHEAGHGMYEQGSPMKWDRTALAGGVSLGWHESQSRTWENIVGRSKPFWDYFYPDLQAAFPQLAGVDQDTFYRATNRVEPTLIRVEADEVTYNLHIMIRYELECALLTGELAVKDLPGAWNEKYRSYLGISSETDSNGCLQDVHWSGGMMGYFPTYSMGNILSYQVWEALEKDLGDVDGLMRGGDFAPILRWLIDHVYSEGRRTKPQELIQRVCGSGLDAEPYLRRISKKYKELYGI